MKVPGRNRTEKLEWALSVAEAARFTRLLDYRPYEKQREFHALGAQHRERLLMAGNQLGKTYAGAAELAMHLTGRYPAWWKGRRFDRPGLFWAAGISNEQTRDNAQRLLLGPDLGDGLGTGMIPRDCMKSHSLSRGLADFVDQAQIQHVSGGVSTLSMKSYEQKRKKWQGAPVDGIWCDEEPPQDLYGEAQARTTATNGILYITFTPLLGPTEVVGYYFPTPNAPHRAMVRMTIDDAEHIPPERRAEEIAKYAEHEREARTLGLPIMGSGLVFPVAESAIKVPDFPLPRHWPRIAGLDFGWEHPTAVAWLAWDRDKDGVVLYAEHRLSQALPAVHADAIRARGSWIPVAWPHDGLRHEPGSGIALADQYRAKGVAMLPEKASFAGGKWTLPEKKRAEAGVGEMLEMMQEGRFKVFESCTGWFAERRSYHRKDGVIVARGEDLISASRYACMMRRFARVESRPPRRGPAPGSYDPLSVLH